MKSKDRGIHTDLGPRRTRRTSSPSLHHDPLEFNPRSATISPILTRPTWPKANEDANRGGFLMVDSCGRIKQPPTTGSVATALRRMFLWPLMTFPFGMALQSPPVVVSDTPRSCQILPQPQPTHPVQLKYDPSLLLAPTLAHEIRELEEINGSVEATSGEPGLATPASGPPAPKTPTMPGFFEIICFHLHRLSGRRVPVACVQRRSDSLAGARML